MADKKNEDTATFTITVPIKTYEKIQELQQFFGDQCISQVYGRALTMFYNHFKVYQEFSSQPINSSGRCSRRN